MLHTRRLNEGQPKGTLEPRFSLPKASASELQTRSIEGAVRPELRPVTQVGLRLGTRTLRGRSGTAIAMLKEHLGKFLQMQKSC